VPPLPSHFVGREDLVETLLNQLTSGKRLTFAAVGLPGVGKTALASAIAHHQRVLDHFSDGILWAGLGQQPDVMSALGNWAAALGLDESRLVELEQRRQAVRLAVGQQRLLLVIDDAWDLEAARTMRCGGPNCVHLLTSRDTALARAFAGAEQVFTIPALDDDSAFALLQQVAPEVYQADPTVVQQLAHAVGGLPLALELLGSYLARPESSLFASSRAKAVTKMSDPQQRLQLAQARLGGAGQAVTLQDTIAFSLDGLRETESGRQAVNGFYALGAFAPKPETFSVEAAQIVTACDEAALALLVARNLVELQDEHLALHQALADVARTQLDEVAVTRHRDYYLALANDNREDWQRIGAAYGQIKWAWEKLPLTDVLDFIWALRLYQGRQGLSADSLEWANRGLESARSTENKEAEGTLLNNIGHTYFNLGEREQALDYYNRALIISREAGDRAGVAQILNNIGLTHDNLGERELALEFYNRAVPMMEEVGDRAGLAIALNNIGLVHFGMGKRDEALEFYNRALPIADEVGNRGNTAQILTNIGSLYNSWGQRETALHYYDNALSLMEEVGDRAGLATLLNNMGMVHYNLGSLEQAADFFDRALSIHEEVRNNAGIAQVLNNIGMVQINLHEWESSIEFFNRALSISEEAGDRPVLANVLNNIGTAYYGLGQIEKSLHYFNRALPIMEQVGGRPNLARTLTNIGLIYDSLKQQDEALDFYNRALPIFEEVGDPLGESLARNNMAWLFREQGRLVEAVDELRRVVEIERFVQSPDLESSMANLKQVEAELAGQQKDEN
jgi:tetratricopeptide (TPR) repeat protein